MKITLIQSELFWEDTNGNLKLFSEKIKGIESVDLIILPEMFSTGFTMQPENVAQTMQGETVSWMKETAAEKQAAICGSVIIAENGNYYNRLLFVRPDGEIKQYDKRHLFTLAGEQKIYTRGAEKLIFEYNGFKICPLVCYDLRFPVFSRNTENYDLLIYAANWPKPRISAWDTLLKARAIENMCFVIGVNRTGKDANGHEYVGHSQALDCYGNEIIKPSETEGIFTAELDKKTLLEARQKFGFLNDRDSFTVM